MNLPPVIRDLVSLIGIEAVVLLLEAQMLGCEWRISKTRDSDWYREWSDIIGDGLADKVVVSWGGQDIYFPNCKAALIAERNRKMIVRYEQLLGEGQSSRRAVRQLCRSFKLSDRTVEKIINSPVPDATPQEVQLGLF